MDEVEANFTDNGDKLARVLKQVIGDTYIAVEGKGTDIKNGRVNANLFFASNKRNGLTLESSDRRFIIGNWQDENAYERDWWLGDDKMKEKLIEEVPQFVGYLKCHQVDVETLNRVVKNEARQVLIDLSKTNTTMFFESIKSQDWAAIKDVLVPFVSKNDWDFDKYDHFDANKIATNPPEDKIKRDQLMTLYNNIFQKNINKYSFTRLCTDNGIKIKDVDFNGKTKKGYIFE